MRSNSKDKWLQDTIPVLSKCKCDLSSNIHCNSSSAPIKKITSY